jgi:hypothetical protein
MVVSRPAHPRDGREARHAQTGADAVGSTVGRRGTKSCFR